VAFGSFGYNCTKTNKDNRVLSTAEMYVSGNIRFMQIFADIPWTGRQTAVEQSKTSIFVILVSVIFGNFGDNASVIIYRYVHCESKKGPLCFCP